MVREDPDQPTLAISRDALAAIIVLARAVDAEVAPTGLEDGSNASDDRDVAALEDTPDNPMRAELAGMIAAQNVDAQVDLVALTWIGRGDFEDLAKARQEARSRREGPTARYLLGIPLLGDYLEEGADAVGINVTEEETSQLHALGGEPPAEDDRT
jgi:hypothetical protein